MKNNEVLYANIITEFKSKGITRIEHKSPNNINKFNPIKQKLETKNEIKKRNVDNQIKKHIHNLNSFSIESNSVQNLVHQDIIPKTSYKLINLNNYDNNTFNINNNIDIKNTPFLSNKSNRVLFPNKNDDKKKPTVNLNKNIEEIIKRRILDKKTEKNEKSEKKEKTDKNDKNRQKKKKKDKKIDKKITFSSKRVITLNNIKRNTSLKKKVINFNKNKNDEKNNNKNIYLKENETDKKKEININKKDKYYETKRVSLSFEKENSNDNNDNIDNNNNDKIVNISNINCNTEENISEIKNKFYERANSLRGANYDYDSSCIIEDDLKSQKNNFFKSKSKSNEKNENNNYTYDTINIENISNFEEKDKNSKKDINQIDYLKENNKQNITDKENIIPEKESHKEDIEGVINKNDDTKNSGNESVNKNMNKIIENNNSLNNTVNPKELCVNTNINLNDDNNNNNKYIEKNNLNNNSIPKINNTKKEIENINKIISNTIKNVSQNLNLSNKKEEQIKDNKDKETIISTESKDQKTEKKENSSLNPSDSKLSSSNNSSNIKQNIYAPKKISNKYLIKHNITNNNNEFINNQTEYNNNNKNINEKQEDTQKITYTKKLAPSIMHFQKLKNSLNYKREIDNNKTEIKIKNKDKFNSSFEGTKSLQMNNIFMNNNIYNNNFNYPYHDSYSIISPKISNNCFYNLNNNANEIFYGINNPSPQIFFPMNNNKNINKIQFLNLNNSFNNSRNHYKEKDQGNFKNMNINSMNSMNSINSINIRNKEELLNNINFEDFIILDRKILDIKNTLSEKNIIVNECFEYLNYYYNSSIYKNIDYLLNNNNNNDNNNIKICLGYKILSIMICYNCSFDINNFEQTHLLLKEMLDLNYKNTILLYEYILENIIDNNCINIKNNLWLLKMKNIINNYRNYEENSIYNEYIAIDKDKEMTYLEKIKINTNFVINNINIILNNIKTKNNEYLMSMFKSMNETIYKNIFFYFFNYILHIINYQGSIVGNVIMQNQLLNNINIITPYIKTKNIKKYSLVLDLEETLLHFNINIINNNEGIVDIRPGTIKFLDDISEFYELIVFNEGEQQYTDLLIDSLEENKIYFEHRFYREHIIIDNNDVVKDLNRIGRALDKILIIDNMPQNFKYHKDNGIMIKSFWGDNPNDNILNDLAIILIKIAKDGGDIRNGIIKYKNEIVNKIMIADNTNI